MTSKILIAVAILAVAYLAASHYRKQGYNFWRTFVLMIVMEVGIAAILISGLG